MYRYTVCSLEPFGTVYLGYTHEGLCRLSTSIKTMVVQGQFPVQDHSQGSYWQEQLNRWFQGEAVAVPLDLSAVSGFARRVLEATRSIPRGQVRPYQWVAKEAGSPRASRAVGAAMARNPIPLFIPCHRVVTAAGHIGRYSMGGPEVKRQLLEQEGVDVVRLERLAAGGFRYQADQAAGVYCYPTCTAHTEGKPRLLRSKAQAEAASLHPCPLCRPV